MGLVRPASDPREFEGQLAAALFLAKAPRTSSVGPILVGAELFTHSTPASMGSGRKAGPEGADGMDYFPIFLAASVSYLLAVLIVHLLVPKLEPAKIDV